MLYDGVNQYVYDAEGRLCAMQNMVGDMFGYIYDAEGRRVAKGTLSSLSCDITTNGFAVTNSYVLGLNGEQVSETDGANNWLHTNVFAAGGLLATYTGTDTDFALNDWLGTKRGQYSATTGALTTYASLPYGDNLTTTAGSGPDATEHHFTGKVRDIESGNDYFGARYYANIEGRFLSPDPGWFLTVDLNNPQSWNQYSYVENNPLEFTDPTGFGLYLDCDSDPPDTGGSTMNEDGQTVVIVHGNIGKCKVVDDGSGEYIPGLLSQSHYTLPPSPQLFLTYAPSNANVPTNFDYWKRDMKTCLGIAGQTFSDDMNPFALGAGTAASITSSMSQASAEGAAMWSVQQGVAGGPFKPSVGLSGFIYDAAGNVLNDGVNQYMYDAEGGWPIQALFWRVAHSSRFWLEWEKFAAYFEYAFRIAAIP